MDAAFGVQERAAVGLDEAVGDPTPLGGPLGVARHRAGREHVAARVHDGLEIGWFAAEGRGHRLVDQREPPFRFALADADQPELGRGHELEVDVANVTGEVEGPLGQRRGGVEVGHPIRPSEPGPGVWRAWLDGLEQPLGAGDPPVGRGKVVEVGLVRDRQPQRAVDCTDGICRVAEQPVGDGALIDARLILAQPPQRPRQAETSRRGVAFADRRLEACPGFGPPAGVESRLATRRGVDRGHTPTRCRRSQASVTVSISTSPEPACSALTSTFDGQAFSK